MRIVIDIRKLDICMYTNDGQLAFHLSRICRVKRARGREPFSVLVHLAFLSVGKESAESRRLFACLVIGQ